MFRLLCASVLVCISLGTCRADNIPLFTDVPTTYLPGVPFSFEVTVPLTLGGNPVNGISSFNANILFDAAVTSPDLTASAAQPSSNYIFSGLSSNFQSITSTGPGPKEVSLQFTDSINPNYVTSSGSNYILGIVTVNPGADLTGAIEISFSTSSFNSSAGKFVPTNVAYFSEENYSPQSSVFVDQGIPPIPTPASWLMLSIGTLVLAGRQRLKSRRATGVS